jgi:hypothetical protein
VPGDEIRVIGDPTRFRTQLRLRIQTGGHVLAELASVRERLAAEYAHESAPADGKLKREVRTDNLLSVVRKRQVKWIRSSEDLVERYLGVAGVDYFDYLKPGKAPAEWSAQLDWWERLDQSLVDALKELLSRVPRSRQRRSPADSLIQAPELEVSGLLEPELVQAYLSRMSSVRTRRATSQAIGAAKELVEATLEGVLHILNEPAPRPRDDLLGTAKRVQVALRDRGLLVAPDAQGIQSTANWQTHLLALIQDLAEWRNDYGTGHGHRKLPSGLAPRHGRLASDAALSYVRFLVVTLDDFGLLSLPGSRPQLGGNRRKAPPTPRQDREAAR